MVDPLTFIVLTVEPDGVLIGVTPEGDAVELTGLTIYNHTLVDFTYKQEQIDSQLLNWFRSLYKDQVNHSTSKIEVENFSWLKFRN